MREKVSAVAIQDKHEEEFGIQARRRNVIFQEKLVSGIHCLLKEHKEAIGSSQLELAKTNPGRRTQR
jgi:hypothetical protein